jgi:hypothetical protein
MSKLLLKGSEGLPDFIEGFGRLPGLIQGIWSSSGQAYTDAASK